MSEESPYRSGIWLRFGDAPVDLPGPGDVSDATDEALRGWRHRVVEPVVASLLTAEELEELSVRAGRPPEAGDVWVCLTARGEQFRTTLLSPQWSDGQDDEEVAGELASQLQDWIAESRFAWGQLRVPDYRLG